MQDQVAVTATPKSERASLTKRYVESLKPVPGENVQRFDDKLAGFGVRVMPSGRRFYFVRYRNPHGRSRWFTIGEHGKLTADAARVKARQIFQAVAEGKDPSGEREAFRAAPTVGELLDRYLTEHVDRRNKTRAEIRRIVERYIRPEIGRLKVAAVTRQDLDKLHRGLASSPCQANIVLAVCSKAFSLAEVWAMRPEGSNPCTKIERNPVNKRERFLTADELGRLGVILRQAEGEGLPRRGSKGGKRTVYPRVITAAIELLLFTGCRLSEILNLRWDRVDFEAGTIALDETKAGKPQVVVMNAGARLVLMGLDTAQRSPWVLPAPAARRRSLHVRRVPGLPIDGGRALSVSTIEGAWKGIKIAAGIADVHLHDLRHTVGTYAGQSGANAFMVRDLLRHKTLAMTGRYVNRADDPVRALSDQVGERIAAGLAGRRAADVVPMKRGA